MMASIKSQTNDRRSLPLALSADARRRSGRMTSLAKIDVRKHRPGKNLDTGPFAQRVDRGGDVAPSGWLRDCPVQALRKETVIPTGTAEIDDIQDLRRGAAECQGIAIDREDIHHTV